MMVGLELQRLACLSTAHLTPEIARALDAIVDDALPMIREQPCWCDLIVADRRSDYGWWVWVGSDGRALMPDPLRACLELAEAAGADWLQFDRDCAPIADLPTYDW